MGLLSRSDVDRTVYKTPPISIFRSDLLIGYNPAVSDVAFEDIWPTGGTRTWITTAAVVDIVSDDANDTAAGTGARSLDLIGLDDDLNIITETIAMNGITSVQTTQLFKRISLAEVATTGTVATSNTNPAAGKISLSSGGDLQMTIEPTSDGGSTGRQTGLFGTIPTEFTGYIDSLIVNTDPRNDMSVNLFTRRVEDLSGGAFTPRLQPLKVFFPSGLGQLAFPNPIVLPSRHDIWMTAKNIGTPGDLEININAVVRLVKNG